MRMRETRKTSKFFSIINELRSLMNLKVLLIGSSLLIAVIIGFTSWSTYIVNRLDNSTFIDIPSNDSIVEANVFEIASYFGCTCGECNEKSLDQCRCRYATEERELIRDFLEKSVEIEVIIQEVINRYGGLKQGISLDKTSEIQLNNTPHQDGSFK
ncbi:MAG: hypothetical protein KKA84_09285 [Bacteroidetes bacterium]|nr:hypothetical protein [Bacteroidota bacterium]